MTQTWRTSPPLPVPSNTSVCKLSMRNENLDDELSTIQDNDNDRRDAMPESEDKPRGRLSRRAMGKRPSKDSFTSTLGKCVVATKFSCTSAQPLHPECWEICMVWDEEDEREPAPLVSKKIFNSAFKCFNAPANEYIYYRKYSNKAGEQLDA